MKKVKSTRGGARANAGRKKLPKELKKVAIWLYVLKSRIDAAGGEDAFKQKLEDQYS